MAQISGTLYNDIADAYAAIDDALSGISVNARIALDAIVDVDSTTYTPYSSNPSDVFPDADAALEIELALLQVYNTAYVVAGNIENSNSGLLDAVASVNDFVIRNQDSVSVADGTAKEKLDYFVNTQMENFWTTPDTIPSGWTNMSTDAGYDTTDWTGIP